MAQYAIIYLGGDEPSSPEEGKAQFARYQAWLGSLGEQAVVPMQPYKGVRSIAPDGSISEGSSVAMSGHTVIEAKSMEAALAIARECPFLETNGTLEVAELMQMDSR